MSRFEGLFSRLKNGQKLFVEYWKKSPSTKIIIINTGVYVVVALFSASGSSKSYLKILWSNIFPVKDLTCSKGEFTLFLPMDSLIWVFLV